MEAASLSGRYSVRRLNSEDVGIVYDLCRENHIFYRYHPPFVTRESILEDMAALPPGKTGSDKYYVGFFEDDVLVAVMDLIAGYPSENTAFIGFFMTDVKYQRRGIGSGIINDIRINLKKSNFGKIRLGVDRGNPQSLAFWLKNKFTVVSEGEYIIMESVL